MRWLLFLVALPVFGQHFEVEISSDNGATWSALTSLNTQTTVNGQPAWTDGTLTFEIMFTQSGAFGGHGYVLRADAVTTWDNRECGTSDVRMHPLSTHQTGNWTELYQWYQAGPSINGSCLGGPNRRIRWVNADAVPVANFTYESSGSNDLQYTFIDQSTDDNYIAQWNWNIDGAAYTNQNPIHVFSQYGQYTVTLTVLDGIGQQHSVQEVINVQPGGTGSGGTGCLECCDDLTDLLELIEADTTLMLQELSTMNSTLGTMNSSLFNMSLDVSNLYTLVNNWSTLHQQWMIDDLAIQTQMQVDVEKIKDELLDKPLPGDTNFVLQAEIDTSPDLLQSTAEIDAELDVDLPTTTFSLGNGQSLTHTGQSMSVQVPTGALSDLGIFVQPTYLDLTFSQYPIGRDLIGYCILGFGFLGIIAIGLRWII